VGGTVSLSPGQSFTRTFVKAGTYDYSCSFHPYMTAKVVVA
jgi:plastocyanin